MPPGLRGHHPRAPEAGAELRRIAPHPWPGQLPSALALPARDPTRAAARSPPEGAGLAAGLVGQQPGDGPCLDRGTAAQAWRTGHPSQVRRRHGDRLRRQRRTRPRSGRIRRRRQQVAGDGICQPDGDLITVLLHL
ncbi:hypothetical protein G6F59_017371 [Rhizopus arrhizus]|nr:hypothetical protein G6F59_017371 [Rhizopus arrhizus]